MRKLIIFTIVSTTLMGMFWLGGMEFERGYFLGLASFISVWAGLFASLMW